jgi:hypothetical protein
MSNKIQRANKLFASNTEQNEVHFTSDGFAFFDKAAAEGHASRLSNREIATIFRDGAQEVEAEVKNADEVFLQILQSKTKKELLAIAAEAGLEGVTGKETNAVLIEKIVAHGKATKAAEQAVAPVITPQSEADAVAAMKQNAEVQTSISDEDKAKVATA